jgi:hypothetical protein
MEPTVEQLLSLSGEATPQQSYVAACVAFLTYILIGRLTRHTSCIHIIAGDDWKCIPSDI